MRYAIGDVHGCFDELQSLVHTLGFNKSCDELIFVGDLVGRGPQALEVLKFVEQGNHQMVLGNYDIHLACALKGFRTINPDDKLQVVLDNQPDYWASYLLQQPLLLDLNDTLVVHAGLFPNFSLEQYLEQAKLGEKFLSNLNQQDALDIFNRVALDDSNSQHNPKFIIDCFATIRYLEINQQLVDNKLKLNYGCKVDYFSAASNADQSINYQDRKVFPWFKCDSYQQLNREIVFGHWSTLSQIELAPNIKCIDTSCVYGGSLTAYNLDNKQLIAVTSQQPTYKG